MLVTSFAISLNPDLDIPPDAQDLLLAKLTDFAPLLDIEADIMQRFQQESFADEGATFGTPWQPNALSTAREKARRGYSDKTMVRTGLLESQIGQAVAQGQSDVSVGIDAGLVPYTLYSQPEELGGANTGGGRQPPRILISVTEEEVEQVQQAIQGFYDETPGVPPGAVIVTLL